MVRKMKTKTKLQIQDIAPEDKIVISMSYNRTEGKDKQK